MRDLTKTNQNILRKMRKINTPSNSTRLNENEHPRLCVSLPLLERLGNLSSSVKPTQHCITKAQNKTWNKQHFLSHILL